MGLGPSGTKKGLQMPMRKRGQFELEPVPQSFDSLNRVINEQVTVRSNQILA
jgi:hypothetical protein